MSVGEWVAVAVAVVSLLCSGLAFPALLKRFDQVGELEKSVAALQARYDAMRNDCQRHQSWLGDLQKDLQAIRRGVDRLLAKAGLDEPD